MSLVFQKTTTKQVFLGFLLFVRFSGSFFRKKWHLVVVFPKFERLVVNQITTKRRVWYLFRIN